MTPPPHPNQHRHEYCRFNNPHGAAQPTAGGFVDPSLTERTGLPLAGPFEAGELLEMRGWGYRNRWIGCGLVASQDGPRAVAVITHREDPASAGFPQGASWAEKLRIVTGWEPIPGPRVDWPAIEADLGTQLPSDYKEIVDLFGAGSFDEYFELAVPGGPRVGRNPWKRCGPDLASGGLLPWGWSEYELGLMWSTGATDPDEWTVVTQSDGEEQQFDCGTGEFILRMLTDVQLGYPMSHASGHFFVWPAALLTATAEPGVVPGRPGELSTRFDYCSVLAGHSTSSRELRRSRERARAHNRSCAPQPDVGPEGALDIGGHQDGVHLEAESVDHCLLQGAYLKTDAAFRRQSLARHVAVSRLAGHPRRAP
ncbi:hypothetical protein [Streptomyces sp. NPDC051286]|uniref:hypothetical protein n=1 Tax=Streptomyces sp. NPDC051286 TaxID=3365647 RepID=UPI0037890EFE